MLDENFFLNVLSSGGVGLMKTIHPNDGTRLSIIKREWVLIINYSYKEKNIEKYWLQQHFIWHLISDAFPLSHGCFTQMGRTTLSYNTSIKGYDDTKL